MQQDDLLRSYLRRAADGLRVLAAHTIGTGAIVAGSMVAKIVLGEAAAPEPAKPVEGEGQRLDHDDHHHEAA